MTFIVEKIEEKKRIKTNLKHSTLRVTNRNIRHATFYASSKFNRDTIFRICLMYIRYFCVS